MRDASKNAVYAKKKQKTENRKQKEKENQQEKNRYEDTHSTRCRPPHGEVYLAPEDDNRLQINCNYVDIVRDLQTRRWAQAETPSAYWYLNLYRQLPTVNK